MHNATVRYCAKASAASYLLRGAWARLSTGKNKFPVFYFMKSGRRIGLGQATMEYLVIFAALTAIALIGFGVYILPKQSFIAQIRASGEDFFQRAAGGMK